jgi:hypothetical protein
MAKFYRYDAEYYSYLDEYENVHCSSPSLKLTEFNLVKETDKTWCISYEWDRDLRHTKLVRKKSKKKFAYLTIEEAKKAFLFRKRRQVSILTEKLKRAQMELNLAESLNNI